MCLSGGVGQKRVDAHGPLWCLRAGGMLMSGRTASVPTLWDMSARDV